MVTESVGISPVLVSKSYSLPESRWEEKPRLFLSIDTKPAALEQIEKQDKSLSDVTKKIPQKLKERKPPEVIIVKPEKPPQPKKPRLPGEKSLFTLGAGYGPSGGSGLGGFVQFNTKKGFSFHVGAGLYPSSYIY